MQDEKDEKQYYNQLQQRLYIIKPLYQSEEQDSKAVLDRFGRDQGLVRTSQRGVNTNNGYVTFWHIPHQQPPRVFVHKTSLVFSDPNTGRGGGDDPRAEIQWMNQFARERKRVSYVAHIVEAWEIDRGDGFTAVHSLSEWGGYDLFSLIDSQYKRHGSMPENHVRHLFQQIVSGLCDLHLNKGLCHRDLKPENMVVSADGNNILKFIDFGTLTWDRDRKNGEYVKQMHPRGTSNHMSPECGPICLPPHVREQNGRSIRVPYKGYIGSQNDVYSCGIVLFVMVFGFPPYEVKKGEGEHPGRTLIRHGNFRELIRLWDLHSKASPEVIDLLDQMLAPAAKRIKTLDLRYHPWTRMVTSEQRQSYLFAKQQRRAQSLAQAQILSQNNPSSSSTSSPVPQNDHKTLNSNHNNSSSSSSNVVNNPVSRSSNRSGSPPSHSDPGTSRAAVRSEREQDTDLDVVDPDQDLDME